MFATLIMKELRAIVLSPKFVVTFAVCSLLILLSIFTGIKEYQASVGQWESATQLADQQAHESTSWRNLSYETQRRPDPMQIFVSGLNYDIGRWSDISRESSVKLRHSPYSDDPIFAVFRHVDFTFIVQIVLSLLAILFSYDAVNGEREAGTLRLVFSNSVPRARYLLAKCTGAWLGLVVPVIIPILLGLLLVIGAGVPLTGTHWAKIITLLGLSVLFFSFFIALGVFVSALTRRSNVSFLTLLVVWVFLVLIIPRAGVMAASQFVRVPRVAEIEGQRDGFAKDLWAEHYKRMEERWHQRTADGVEEDDIDEEAMWARMQEEDSLRRDVERRIEEYEVKLLEDLHRRKTTQARLAFKLARISPVSAYQLGAMSLAGTGIDLKSRYEESMSEYRQRFNDYAQKKQAESDDPGGGFVSITISSETGFKIGTGRDVSLDISDMPRYQPPTISYRAALAPMLPDAGILGIGTLLAFLGAFIAFLRYDLR
jgi:ABC-type transport system involved in multi-copper enzyme maturation permease subunit